MPSAFWPMPTSRRRSNVGQAISLCCRPRPRQRLNTTQRRRRELQCRRMHLMRAPAFTQHFRLLASASIAIVPTESQIKVKGLEHRAEILIDQWGVPHIYAGTGRDAFFAHGWNAARDRLWQMDLWRRSGLGELSAALGPSYLAQDRAIRLFVYRGDMQREWAAYGPDAKQDTEAFVAGINAYVAAIKGTAAALPI